MRSVVVGCATVLLVCLAAYPLVAMWIGWGHWAQYNGLGRRLQDAALNGRTAEAQDLIAQGADVNYDDMWTPLQGAIQNHHVDTIKLLIAAGANVNKRSEGGAAALQTAKQYGDPVIIKLLKATGAKQWHYTAFSAEFGGPPCKGGPVYLPASQAPDCG